MESDREAFATTATCDLLVTKFERLSNSSSLGLAQRQSISEMVLGRMAYLGTMEALLLWNPAADRLAHTACGESLQDVCGTEEKIMEDLPMSIHFDLCKGLAPAWTVVGVSSPRKLLRKRNPSVTFFMRPAMWTR